jgi:molybdate transport system regulatory protein
MLRVVFADGTRLGPGKARLLETIAQTGSISAAARTMGMSYRRAWLLVDEMNRLFTEPVVAGHHGGAGGGGAQLTPFGASVAERYRRMLAKAEAALVDDLGALDAAVAPPNPNEPV